jgi:septal ring factor EnvC (AmiA/AmiB activator)
VIVRFCLLLSLGFAAAAPVFAEPRDGVERLRAQLIELGEAEAKAERVVGDQRARLLALNTAQAELDARMAKNRGDMVKLLGALELYQRNPPPALVVSARSAKDAVRAAILIRAVTPQLEQRRVALVAETNLLNKLRRDAAIASAALFESESAAAERRARIDRLMARKSALEASLAPPDPAEQAEARTAAKGGLGALMSAPARREAPPSVLPSQFVVPVQGPLVRRFGQAQRNGAQRNVAVKIARDHDHGLAWLASPGAVVRSPAAGRIDYAGTLKGWGQVLILTLADNHHLVLAGLGAVAGAPGRSVAAGEPVGRMPQGAGAGAGAGAGRDPNAGAELYLEVRRGSAAIDPAPWFRGT